MQAINKLIGAGGTYNWNSTDAYIAGTGVKRAVYAILFDADNEISALEIDGVDVLADYGWTAGDTVLAGTTIFAVNGMSFTKVQTGIADQVTLYRI